MSQSVGQIDLDLGINHKAFDSQLKGIAPSATSMIKSSFGKLGAVAAAAFGAKAMFSFAKDGIGLASDLTEVQNVVDVTFGNMAGSINAFSKTALQEFGLSELSAKKYSSTMGAMLKSSGMAGQGVTDMSIEITKLSADMASFYNLSNEEAFNKIRSGISGETEPLKQLGISMNVANLEAHALATGISKAYKNMSQAEQVMLRYDYLMKASADSHGDFYRNVDTWANQTKILGEQWNIFKGTMGDGFINILTPIVKGLNFVMAKLQLAANYFKAFTELIFGKKAESASTGMAQAQESIGSSAGDAAGGLGKAGKAAKKAGKDLKGSLSGFDEVNTLMKNTADSADDMAGGMDGAGGVGDVDFGSLAEGEFEVDVDITGMEEKFSRMKDIISDFYNNWGMKDIFQGIKEGAALVDFSSIKDNLGLAFSNIGEIASTAFAAAQPIYQAAGEAIGTALKYGIAIVGNIFEPITLGFANFTENMKEPIQAWIWETSETITRGFNNLTNIFEVLGSTWLESIIKFQPQIAKTVEDILTNISNTFMLMGTIIADSFEIITGVYSKWVTDNEGTISLFADNLIDSVLGLWETVNNIWSGALEELSEFWDNFGKSIIETLATIVTDIQGWILQLFNEKIKPVWDHALKWLNKLWSETWRDVLKEIGNAVGAIGDLLKVLWEKVIKPLVDLIVDVMGPKIANTWTFLVDVIGIAVTAVGEQVKAVLKIFTGLITFITGVFTGDWKKAWEGVSKIFGGIMDGLKSLFKTPINFIIAGLNKFLRGLNNIKIPDWVPAVGGKGFTMTEIPMLARGGIIDQPTLAMVGERGKEAVMPLENNTGWITELATKIAGMIGGGGGSEAAGETTLIINIGEDTLVEKIIELINRQNVINGEMVVNI